MRRSAAAASPRSLQQLLLLVDITHELGKLVVAVHQALAHGGSALQVIGVEVWSGDVRQ